MKLKFLATFSIDDYRKHGITKADDLVVLRYEPEYREKVRGELRKITEKNKKNESQDKPPVLIEVSLDIHYSKRSLDQNRWLWAAHTLEANLINNGLVAWDDRNVRWQKAGIVTPEMIHHDYMERYAPRGYIEVEAGFVDTVRKMVEDTYGHVMGEEWLPKENKMRFEIWKTSSYMNVAEFCELADHVTDQIMSYGVDINNAADFNVLLDDLEAIKKQQEPDIY